jgi:hypothetical protein
MEVVFREGKNGIGGWGGGSGVMHVLVCCCCTDFVPALEQLLSNNVRTGTLAPEDLKISIATVKLRNWRERDK